MKEILKTIFAPWVLPEGMKKTSEMTDEELEEEARNERHFKSAYGMRNSGMFHYPTLRKQFIRTAEYEGADYVFMWVMYYVAPIIAPIGLIILAYFTFNVWTIDPNDVRTGTADFVPLSAIISIFTVSGLAVGLPATVLTVVGKMFNVAYADALVAMRDGFGEVIALLDVKLRRLGFVHEKTADSRPYFTGPDGHDGFIKGDLHLELKEDSDLNLYSIRNPQELYGNVELRKSTHTGSYISQRGSLTDIARRVGELEVLKHEYNKKPESGFRNWVNNNKGLSFLALSALIAFIILAVGLSIVDTV